ncbi:hypothetical protein JCM33374_g4825 [Metschnikowia sp. JCM 33374]|nr:hypothetical protein JCM33374_g4825 [Metschnikowia sp. JCM 33374]
MSSYTTDQEKVVLRVLSYKPHQYYEILECEKTASDSVIKKSYRKLAVKLHPDKNSHPRASTDPDSRFAGYSNSSPGSAQTSGFSRGFGHGGGGVPRGFEDDIFNMFFGGGGAPGGHTFTFGGNQGFTFQSFGNGFDPFTGAFAQQQRQRQRQRQTQQNATEPNSWETLRQLAPILLVLLATLFSSLFSGSNSPEYSFTKTPKFSVQRTMPTFDIPYFVSENFIKEKNERTLHKFDTKVENTYVQDKRAKCGQEHLRKNEMLQDAQGWFFTDERRMEQARNMPMPACSELKGMGIL